MKHENLEDLEGRRSQRRGRLLPIFLSQGLKSNQHLDLIDNEKQPSILELISKCVFQSYGCFGTMTIIKLAMIGHDKNKSCEYILANNLDKF